MLKINNTSPFTVGLYPGWNQNSQHQLTCVIKASYRFTTQSESTLKATTTTIVETDIYNDPLICSDLQQALEIMPYKKLNEILLINVNKPATSRPIPKLTLQWRDKTVNEKTMQLITECTRPQNLWHKITKSQQRPKQSSNIDFGPLPREQRNNNPNNYAPTDQRYQRDLTQITTITLEYFYAGCPQITLSPPKIWPQLTLDLPPQPQHLNTICDTITLDVEAQQMDLIWRTAISWQANDQRCGQLTVE